MIEAIGGSVLVDPHASQDSLFDGKRIKEGDYLGIRLKSHKRKQ